MPAFVEISPDPFATSFRAGAVGDANQDQGRADEGKFQAFGNFDHVRRPVRGIQIKNDTYATIQVRRADGTLIKLIDSGGESEEGSNIGFTTKYSNFLLQSVQEQRAEKMQVVQTFGEPFVFFFGEHPRMISCSGILLNTEDFNWRAEFWENYDRYLRGTKCVQSKTRVTLSWDDIVVEGYMTTANASESSQQPNQVSLQFQLFLTNYQNVSNIGNTEFPKSISAEVNLDPEDIRGVTGEFISDTQKVRSLNSGAGQRAPAIKNSLFQSVRDRLGDFVKLDGQLRTLRELANAVSGGRRVQAPFGFAGGAVFDQEVQIALASVSADDRKIILRGQVAQLDTTLTRLITQPAPVTFGKIRDNRDEYIATSQSATNAPVHPPSITREQQIANDIDATTEKVRKVFKSFGIETEPPREVVNIAASVSFGSVSVDISESVDTEEAASGLRNIGNALF